MSAPAASQAVPQPPAPARSRSDDQRLVIHCVDWEVYETFLNSLKDRHIFLTYDRGNLELMVPSYPHERFAYCLGYFISLLALELDIPHKAGRCTTFKRKDLERGLEPDNCFWIRNVAAMYGVKELDLSRDPPPDLVIEIDITTSWLDRKSIYIAMGVPEIWCFDGESLRVYERTTDGKYQMREGSIAFPFLPMGELIPFLQRLDEVDDTEMARSFIAWVRSKAVSSWKNGPRKA